ncbi:hypothetical protein ALTERO38_52069 [Alteromonas sp. 38]|nr:hypothetical protein ALTER154_50157 [Alteromonas sp. 154]VXB97738.1 hypothetical protein ALTERO38_52069 [Alteromonas sp. 38]
MQSWSLDRGLIIATAQCVKEFRNDYAGERIKSEAGGEVYLLFVH